MRIKDLRKISMQGPQKAAVLQEFGRGRRRFPDEEGTERCIRRYVRRHGAGRVAEDSPMRRGLKAHGIAVVDARRETCDVAEDSPMRRGLKGAMNGVVRASISFSRRRFPDEEGTERAVRSYAVAVAEDSPMRRGLKGAHRAVSQRHRRRRRFPDEEGTERQSAYANGDPGRCRRSQKIPR